MMRFSSQYHKRRAYVKQMKVPSFCEAKKQLGDELAQVLFDDCPESLKDEMGLSHTLNGPGPNLWISPSDLLIGKVVLTPPLTAKHTKALTHEGILNLGEQIEAQWLAAVDLEKQTALENLESMLMMLAERDKERAVSEALASRDAEYKEYLEKLHAEFDELLRIELAKLEDTLREYYEQLIEEKTNEILGEQTDYINKRIEDAVADAVQDITEKFLRELEEQEKELTEIFNARLEGQHDRFQEELNFQEQVFLTVMKQLKHNLQCNNISCLMYVLCMERRKCLKEQQNIVDTTKDRMMELERLNANYEDEVEQLKRDCVEKQHQLTVREDCLLGVIAQFQKFINYALRAVPTQAEFLLSVEKMMTFELCQALARTQDGKRTHLARLIMPWKSISNESLPPSGNLNVQTYHDCLNELKMPKCPQPEADPTIDELYAMTYKDHLYVREDFRNQVTQDLFQVTSSTLWSKDVQDLITLIKNIEAPEFEQEAEKITSPMIELSATSSVHFVRDSGEARGTGLLAARDSMYVHRSKYSNICQDAEVYVPSIEEVEISEGRKRRSSSGIALLGATDSITLIREKSEHKTVVDEVNLDAVKAVHHIRKRRDTESSHHLEMIQAPSDETLKFQKQHRRMTLVPSYSDSNVVALSDTNIQLSKPVKTGSDDSANKSPHNGRKISNGTTTEQAPKLKSAKHVSTTRQPLRQFSSKFSTHKDSLELCNINTGSNFASKKLKNLIMPMDVKDTEYPIQQFVINAPSDTRDFPDVNFKKIAEVFQDLNVPERPWKIYPPKKMDEQPSAIKPSVKPVTAPTNFLKKRNVAKIVGATTTEVNKTDKDFTIHRIHSLMDVLKKDDSLIRMFTQGGQ